MDRIKSNVHLCFAQLLEVFGAGTACVVWPVATIAYQDTTLQLPVTDKSLALRFYNMMGDIHYGRVKHPWAVDVD